MTKTKTPRKEKLIEAWYCEKCGTLVNMCKCAKETGEINNTWKRIKLFRVDDVINGVEYLKKMHIPRMFEPDSILKCHKPHWKQAPDGHWFKIVDDCLTCSGIQDKLNAFTEVQEKFKKLEGEI